MLDYFLNIVGLQTTSPRQQFEASVRKSRCPPEKLDVRYGVRDCKIINNDLSFGDSVLVEYETGRTEMVRVCDLEPAR